MRLNHSAVRPLSVFPGMSVTAGCTKGPHHCPSSGASAPSAARRGQSQALADPGGEASGTALAQSPVLTMVTPGELAHHRPSSPHVKWGVVHALASQGCWKGHVLS